MSRYSFKKKKPFKEINLEIYWFKIINACEKEKDEKQHEKVRQCLQWRDVSLCLPSNRKGNYVEMFFEIKSGL